jgi:hypothetical protein
MPDIHVDFPFRKTGNALANGDSAAVYLPHDLRVANVMLDPGAGVVAAYVEYTTDTRDVVVAGTAKWTKWAAGDVGVDTMAAVPLPVTAVRCHSDANGATAMTIVGAR